MAAHSTHTEPSRLASPPIARDPSVRCRQAHFDAAMMVARKSVSAADVKKFERFRKSMLAAKG